MPKKHLRSRLESLLKRLKKQKAPDTLVNLADVLFSSAQPEDLQDLGVDGMEWLARRALDFIEVRKPGQARVDISDPDGPAEALTDISLTQALNDNMPFLVDSLLGYLAGKGLDIRLLLHPVLRVERDEKGRLVAIERRAGPGGAIREESLIHLHTRRMDEGLKARVIADMKAIQRDVRAAVLDWPLMRQRVEDIISEYQAAPPPMPVEELTEVLAFLQWLADDNFVFLGVRDYEAKDGHEAAEKDALGILRGADERDGEEPADAPREALCLPGTASRALVITKSPRVSTVHRRVPMDLIAITRFDAAGEPAGETHVLGLFASSAYVRAARDIPLVRRKITRAMQLSGLDRTNHLGKALLNILETFPRDELFELDSRTLLKVAMGILRLEERPRPRVFIWRGCSARFVSAFAFIPRDRFDTRVRRQVSEILETALGARVSDFSTSFSGGVLVRVHFRFELLNGNRLDERLDMDAIEARVSEAVRSWPDRMAEAARAEWGPRKAARIVRLYDNAFSQAYMEAYSPQESLRDLEIIESLDGREGDVAVHLFRTPADAANVIRLKLYHSGAPLPLAARVPILGHAGLSSIEERTFNVRRGGHEQAREIFIHEMVLQAEGLDSIDLEALGPKLEDSFLAVWNGHAEDDSFNALTLTAGLDWREVSILRAIARWLHQAAIPYSGAYIAATLRNHPGLTDKLLEIFTTLFKPGRARRETRVRKARALRKEALAGLAKVQSLDEDRIFRMYLTTLMAMRRTNFWQGRESQGLPAPVAFKLAASEVDFLPDPKPWAEIFVHAPDVEGVHLRGGPVARGGIRWSDRPQDFRTEILGLVKAQNVKNAVIVPVGAKGGFIVRKPPAEASREAQLEAGKRAYRRFISTLLDMTDNIVDGETVPPERIVRLDGDDPYLVVAADKGTASFSDMANALARQHGYWLDDAFASGGSAGYDHKKMGITARGAWEAVKRHFREMGVDIQKEPVTVIGVGDMSGDVFGNGMLLSKAIKLVAAFDHRDIFLDPDPDPATAWKERKRLFNLPRSSWRDYDRKKISKGGGVFSRKLKSIPLSAEARALLEVEDASLTPNELIRAILRARAGLLWLGGIGTYVRASSERDADVGDTANDPVRVTAKELRVRAVGEGANLGLTQKARIEYALGGGRVNMDAIDNSAGVNTSDMEVNMKIAFGAAEKAGKLTRKERNALLAEMEDGVAALVLRNNYLQTLCLSMAQARAAAENGDMIRLMHALENRGALDRKLEDLPLDSQLAERRARGQALTRPELAVLMSYAKIVLFDDLLECGIVDRDWFREELMAYFPPLMRERQKEEIETHRLRREIIANRLGNAMINHGGPAFVSRKIEETGRGVAEIAAAFALAWAAFGMRELNAAIDRLDGRIDGERQLEFYLLAQKTLRRASAWFLRNEDLTGALSGKAGEYRAGLERFEGMLREVITPHARKRLRLRRAGFAAAGAPAELARRLARLPYLLRGLDIMAIAARTGAEMEDAAHVYFESGHLLRISAVMMAARRLKPSSHYERMARARLSERLAAAHRELAAAMAREGKGGDGPRLWAQRHATTLERTRRALSEILAGQGFDLPRLALAASLFDELAMAVRRDC